jgi:hypothetical protein
MAQKLQLVVEGGAVSQCFATFGAGSPNMALLHGVPPVNVL